MGLVERITPSNVRRVTLRDATCAPYDELQLVLTVTVANRGDLEATLDYTQSGGPKVAVTYGANAFLTSFKVAGSTDQWYGRLRMPIGAGTTQTLVGDIALRLNRETVMPFTVDADSRLGDEIIPAFIRVQETNENNNTASINVTVP